MTTRTGLTVTGCYPSQGRTIVRGASGRLAGCSRSAMSLKQRVTMWSRCLRAGVTARRIWSRPVSSVITGGEIRVRIPFCLLANGEAETGKQSHPRKGTN